MSVSVELAVGGSVTIYPGANFAINEATLTVIGAGPPHDSVVTQLTREEARNIGESLLAWADHREKKTK